MTEDNWEPDCLDCWGTGMTTLNPEEEPGEHVCWRFATND